MWWHYLIIAVVCMVIGGGVYSWGWNMGVKWQREEDSHRKYLEAMKNDE